MSARPFFQYNAKGIVALSRQNWLLQNSNAPWALAPFLRQESFLCTVNSILVALCSPRVASFFYISALPSGFPDFMENSFLECL